MRAAQPSVLPLLCLFCAVAASSLSPITTQRDDASSQWVFFSHWEENCDPGHLTDSYNFTRCAFSPNGNGSFVGCTDFWNFAAQVDGVLYTAGAMVVDNPAGQLYYRLTSQTVTNIITRGQVFRVDFYGTASTLVVDIDSQNFASCKGCIITGIALSPSSPSTGVGALYFAMGTAIYYCSNIRGRSSPCSHPAVLLPANSTYLSVSSLQLDMSLSGGVGLGTLYFSGSYTTGNSTVGWPGFLASVAVKEFAGIVLTSEVTTHGAHTDLSEFKLNVGTETLYMAQKITGSAITLVSCPLNGSVAQDTLLDSQQWYSYGEMYVPSANRVYWFNQWVENYRQIGMHIVIVDAEGHQAQTSTDYAQSW